MSTLIYTLNNNSVLYRLYINMSTLIYTLNNNSCYTDSVYKHEYINIYIK